MIFNTMFHSHIKQDVKCINQFLSKEYFKMKEYEAKINHFCIYNASSFITFSAIFGFVSRILKQLY